MDIIETKLDFKFMNERKLTERIVLHHSACNKCSPEDIHRWHLNNGWAGAGYHFLVRKDGSIYRLRPENMIGAHAYGNNSNSIGICFEGNFMEEVPTGLQIDSGKELVAYLKEKYNIDKVQAHRDLNKTSCPGKNFPFDEIANAKKVPLGYSIEEIANQVINGKWDNGYNRRNALESAGYNYEEVQAKVNEILLGNKPSKKSNEEIAKEVIAGKYGNGQDRKEKLSKEGYNYNEIQKIVNKLLK